MGTITSANATLTLIVVSLFPAPQTIQGFSTDDAFDSEMAEVGVTRLGVDGFLSAGYVPSTTAMTIHLQADSPSLALFGTWDSTEQQIKDKLAASGVVTMPSRKKQWVLFNGFLRNVKRMPDARRVLEPLQFTIEWERITASPLAGG